MKHSTRTGSVNVQFLPLIDPFKTHKPMSQGQISVKISRRKMSQENNIFRKICEIKKLNCLFKGLNLLFWAKKVTLFYTYKVTNGYLNDSIRERELLQKFMH